MTFRAQTTRVPKNKAERFMVSYGAWLALVQYFEQNEALRLQQLSTYFYRTGMPRVHKAFVFRNKKAIFPI